MAGQRRAELVSIPMGPGVLSNVTPRAAKTRVNYMNWDRWNDSTWVRWHKLLPQKVGGWQYQALVDQFAGDPITYIGLARGLHDWASIDGIYWIAIGTNYKLYLASLGVLYDVTPSRQTDNVMNPFTTQNGSNVVTVVDPSNGAQDQDYVTVQGATAVGGLTLSGEYQLTFVDPDTYTIIASAEATGNATGGGSVSLTYDISAGLASNGELYGYGTYEFGLDEFGTPRPAGTGVYARLRSWSIDNYGQDMIASYSDGEIYWWQRVNGPSSRAALLDPTAPVGCQRVIVDGASRVIIALGCTDVTSVYDAMLVRWCDFDDITVWIPTDTNVAGDYPLTIGSRIVTGIRSKGQNLIWTDQHLYRMVLSGGTAIYSFYGAGTTKIVGPNAAIDVDGVAYWMGFKNFYTYTGVIGLLPCEVWETVFDPNNSTSLLTTQTEKVNCFAYEDLTEITWLYPSIGGSGECDRYVTYNWDDQVWYYGAWNRTAAGNSTPALDGYPYGVNGGYLYQHEIGTDGVEASGTNALGFYMESLDITTGGAKSEYTMGGSDARFAIGGSDSHLRGFQIVPDFQASGGYFNGEMQVTVKTKDRPQQQNYVVNGPVPFTPSTENIFIDFHGSQMRLRFDNFTSDETIVVNDNFQRANSNPIGGIYTPLYQQYPIQILSDLAKGSVSVANNSAVDTTNSYANDQYAIATLGSTPLGGSALYLFVRCIDPTSTWTFQEWAITQGTLTSVLASWVGQGETINLANVQLQTLPAEGDTYALWVQDQTYTMLQNGVIVGTWIDPVSAHTSGVPGFWLFPAGLDNISLSDFQTGDISDGQPSFGSSFRMGVIQALATPYAKR